MSSYPLMKLLAVRTLREQVALRAYSAARQRTDEARREERQLGEELAGFRRQMQQSNEALYRQFSEGVRNQSDFRDLEATLTALRAEEERRVEQLRECAQRILSLTSDCRQAQQAYRQAQHEAEKLRMQQDRWDFRVQQDTGRQRDAELDEIAAVQQRRKVL